MGRYQFELHIDAPRDRVFDAWTDLALMRRWIGGVTDVTDVSGPLTEPGTIYVLWFARMRSQVEVLEVERPRRSRSRSVNRLLSADSEIVLEDDASGTRLTQSFVTHGVVAAIAARVFATGSWKGSFRGELNEFKRLVEAGNGR